MSRASSERPAAVAGRSSLRRVAAARRAGYTWSMHLAHTFERRLERLLGRRPAGCPPDVEKRRANLVILDWLASHDGLGLRTGFVCECPTTACTEVVWLTGEQLARGCLEPGWAALGESHAEEPPQSESDRGPIGRVPAGSGGLLLARSD